MKTHPKFLIAALTATTGLVIGQAAQAETIFITNNSAKTLASNEGDAAALAGDVAGDTTALTLSADDGGGTINVSTSFTLDAFGGNTPLAMDADSMGVDNDKWGANTSSKTWTFSFDQTVSFDGFVFFDSSNITDEMSISSAAWIGNSVTDGSNWSFNSATGTITTGTVPASAEAYNFAGSGLSNVTAGTGITIKHDAGNGAVELQSFTITVIPEPSSLALLGLGGLLVARRRRG